MSEITVEIYTDGACRGNPGPGGWGVLLKSKGREKELFGGERDTTNNRMELTAAIQGLAALKRPSKVSLTTDSQYVRKGITEWIVNWIKNGWVNSAKKPVANSDLWKQLDSLAAQHNVDWHWVKGLSGQVDNERVDDLANRGIDELV